MSYSHPHVNVNYDLSTYHSCESYVNGCQVCFLFLLWDYCHAFDGPLLETSLLLLEFILPSGHPLRAIYLFILPMKLARFSGCLTVATLTNLIIHQSKFFFYTMFSATIQRYCTR